MEETAVEVREQARFEVPRPDLAELWSAGGTPAPRLRLPARTRLLPDECGFVLRDGRYLRLYAHGIEEELPDGTPIGGDLSERRPQWRAFAFRTGRGASIPGALQPSSYLTVCDVELHLPTTLPAMGDRQLVDLAARIRRRVAELELDHDLGGYRARRMLDGRSAAIHVLDLTDDTAPGVTPVR